MVGPKKQNFGPKINIIKGNHCILRIRGAPVCQKMAVILENKVVQKVRNKCFLQKMVSIQKISVDFRYRKLTFKV
jgi:hypothetical protein